MTVRWLKKCTLHVQLMLHTFTYRYPGFEAIVSIMIARL